ncbi:MAG: type VI secretion system baseplate subunit TssG [Polyangiaceae bacterium]|nr:type VI secretion system baseplate subunit TssG [Polyangiaceae bacterium]
MTDNTALLDYVTRTADRFGFFDLVRLLERLISSDAGDVDNERIAFEHVPDLAFPPGDVASVNVDMKIEGSRARVALTFLGLLGTSSPLTPEWTEEVLQGDDTGALRAFYDVFHHRVASLLYAAWKSYSLEGGFDLGGGDAASRRLRSLAGIDAWAPNDDQEVLRPMVALGVADYQYGQPQLSNATAVETLLRRLYPAWNLRVEACARRFVMFGPHELALLGEQHSQLGVDVVYGDGTYDGEGLVRLYAGPVDGDTYQSLMPGGRAYATLQRLARRLFGAMVDVELDVQLSPSDAPYMELGSSVEARLGVDSLYVTNLPDAVHVRVPLVQNIPSVRRTFLL